MGFDKFEIKKFFVGKANIVKVKQMHFILFWMETVVRLRTIGIIKDEFKKGNRNGYLISLDAKKAYDSVAHDYIE